MTTLTGRPNTALLVIDMQNGVVDGAHERTSTTARIAALVERARDERVPVIWVRHSDEDMPLGSDSWQGIPELVRDDAEPLVHKAYGDSFEGTDLDDVLGRAGVGRLVVTGAESDACVRSTIHGAFTRGYDVTLVSDAHTTGDKSAWGAPPPEQVIAHTNLYWGFQAAPGRLAAVVPSADVAFRGA
ncbi:isochorismatase family protein [Cellulomonas timonensis]|uniref:isochorismatase family protein n=1 Tax=Cellulomonas timonensis TaxID=1689271 RepID=UPI00082971EE|nr:isochorismatase family protein [Cellulomonas timonensis]